MRRERLIKERCASKKGAECKDLKNSQPVCVSENVKASSKEQKGMAGLSVSEEFMRLCKQKYCQLELKGAERGTVRKAAKLAGFYRMRL